MDLERAGITQELWTEWMFTRMNGKCGPKYAQPSCPVFCLIGILNGFLLDIPKHTCAKNMWHPFMDALHAWQHVFNEEVLKPLGMFCKSKSYASVVHDSIDGGYYSHINQTLEFALTPAESALLAAEPHQVWAAGNIFYLPKHPEHRDTDPLICYG